MLPKKVESLQHPFVKHCKALRSDKTYREEAKRLLLLGKKEIDAFQGPLLSLISLSSRPDIGTFKERYFVSEPAFEKIAGMKTFDGYAAEVPLPPEQDLSSKQRLLILDQLQDPGNVGTLLRTALALGWDGAVLTPGTADLFNDKALRAAKGASLSLPYQRLPSEKLIALFQKKGFRPYTADTEGPPLQDLPFSPPLALILSREGKGPHLWTEKGTEKVSIPMHSSVESLNVAASGAILLYAMRSR